MIDLVQTNLRQHFLERSALRRHEFKFCGHQAANSGKSSEPLLHRERPQIKSRRFLTNDLKI
jgi:hypothetical protein